MAPLPPVSISAARRVALAAQGMSRRRPEGPVDRRHLRRVVSDLGLLQLDSVNVAVRAQYMPMFSRLGAYDRTLLDRMAYVDHELFEYWGHVASLIDVELQPALRWRMAEGHAWGGPSAVGRTRPDLVDALEARVLEAGPISAAELDDGDRRTGPWWGWGETKQALEYLFWSGRIGALRRGNFERVYCAPADAVPQAILDRPTPTPDVARKILLVQAASMHGIGTAKDLADVWRIPVPQVRPLLAELVEDGALDAVQVDGWREVAYRHPLATSPRRFDACALVSPFDSLMWHRDRIDRLHGFPYTIEIYVPKPKRVYGYYVLPFLLGDTFVARVDLKADRAGSRLLVQSSHVEADLARRGTDDIEVAERLHGELVRMAGWLGLDDVTIAPEGNLSDALATIAAH